MADKTATDKTTTDKTTTDKTTTDKTGKADSKTKRAEHTLKAAQADVDKAAKRVDDLESKTAKLDGELADALSEHRGATARRDHALSNPDLPEDARVEFTPGPTGADTPQSSTRYEGTPAAF